MKTKTPLSALRDPKSETPDPNSRRALVAVLDQFNISTATFDRLRSDSYEKHIAARSLDELEGFYRRLMEPYGSYEEKQKLCPVWKKGGKGEDKLPDTKTLCNIKNRIMAEHVANDLGQHVDRIKSLINRLSGLPADLRKDVYDLMMTVLGEELFKAKFDGKKLMENLPVVKCIMKDKEMKMRDRIAAERLELQKISKEQQKSRLELERDKFEFQVKQATPEPVPAPVKKELPPYDPDVEEAKVQKMIDRIYGLNPCEKNDDAGSEPQKTECETAVIKNVPGPGATLAPNEDGSLKAAVEGGKTPVPAPAPVPTVVDVSAWYKAKGTLLVYPYLSHMDGVGKCLVTGKPFDVKTGKYLNQTEIDELELDEEVECAST